jgi:hypothetical protein
MTTPAAPATASKAGASQPAPLARFRSGTQRTLSSDGYVNSTTPGAAATDLPIYNPSANNYIRGIWITSQCTTSGNAATTAFNGDMPLGCYSTVTFMDANEKPICGPFDSYTLAMVSKFGGYQNLGDPRASAVFTAVTGSGATGGSFTQVLYVPIEVNVRDGFGSLQNQSTGSTFQLKLTLAASTAIYATAPTTLAPVVTKIFEDGWWKGNQAGVAAQPPQAGSTQYWTRGTYNALNGAQQIQVSQGLGYPIRLYMLLNYDVAGNTRSAGDGFFPDPFQLIFKGTSEWNLSKLAWQDQMSRWYFYTSATRDAALGLENGVYILPYHISFETSPGAELADAYKKTNQGDLNQFIASWSGNSKLFVVANYVAFAPGAAPAAGS